MTLQDSIHLAVDIRIPLMSTTNKIIEARSGDEPLPQVL
jgi:hypothetical protein